MNNLQMEVDSTNGKRGVLQKSLDDLRRQLTAKECEFMGAGRLQVVPKCYLLKVYNYQFCLVDPVPCTQRQHFKPQPKAGLQARECAEQLQAETEALRRANEEAQSNLQAKLDQSTAALQETLSKVSRQSSYCQEFHNRFSFSHLHFGL